MGSADGAGEAWKVGPAYAAADGVVMGFEGGMLAEDRGGVRLSFLFIAGDMLTWEILVPPSQITANS